MKWIVSLLVGAAVSVTPYIIERLKSKDSVDESLGGNAVKVASNKSKAPVPENRYNPSAEEIAALTSKAKNVEEVAAILKFHAELINS